MRIDMMGSILFKIAVVAALLVILASLAFGMVFLVRDRGAGTRTARSLTLRIALSIALFVLLFLGYLAGLIKPHGIHPAQPPDAAPQASP